MLWIGGQRQGCDQRAQQLALAGAGGAGEEAVRSVDHHVEREGPALAHSDDRRQRRIGAPRTPGTGVGRGNDAPDQVDEGDGSGQLRSRLPPVGISEGGQLAPDGVRHLGLRPGDSYVDGAAVTIRDAGPIPFDLRHDVARRREPVGIIGHHDAGDGCAAAAEQEANPGRLRLGETGRIHHEEGLRYRREIGGRQ